MSLPRIAIVDTETTGLDRHRHEIWEIAIITGDPYSDGSGYKWTEFIRQIQPYLEKADPGALRVNRYYERLSLPVTDPAALPRNNGYGGQHWDDPRTAALTVATALSNRTVIGAVPDFDAYRLDDWLLKNGQCAAWKYHLVDVETLVAGYFRGVLDMLRYAPKDFSFGGDLIDDDIDEISTPDWRSTELMEAFGIPSPEGRHSAIVDARWARDAYCKVYRIQV